LAKLFGQVNPPDCLTQSNFTHDRTLQQAVGSMEARRWFLEVTKEITNGLPRPFRRLIPLADFRGQIAHSSPMHGAVNIFHQDEVGQLIPEVPQGHPPRDRDGSLPSG